VANGDPGNFLVPDAAGRAPVGDNTREVAFGRDAVPTDLLLASVLGIYAAIGEVSDWSVLVDQSPLIPDLDSWLEEQPLEREIRVRLPHLEAVCSRPEQRLVVDAERVPVGRARRLAPGAAELLAARTEDWQRRTLHGVYPRRILALRRDQVVDFYENRVASRLIEHLLKYLDKRLGEVRKVLRQLDDLDRYGAQLTELKSWRAQHRAASLMGALTATSESRAFANIHLTSLRALRARVASLMDSRLYRSVSRGASVGVTLTMTNLFVNDQHYRHVALLWRSWAQLHAASVTPEQLFARNQEFCRGFDKFCVLLVARALDGLGFANASRVVPRAGEPAIQLSGSLGPLELSVDTAGVIQLSARGTPILRLVPLPDRIVRGGLTTTEALTAGLRSADPGIHTVVLYTGDSDDRAKLDLALATCLNTLGNDASHEARSKVGLLPVTPLELDSGERVTRAVRWSVGSLIVASYPTRARIDRDASSALQSRMWCRVEGDEVVIRRPPREDELDEAERAIVRLVRRDAATAAARRAGARSFSKTTDSLAKAVSELTPLLTCPVCLQSVPPSPSIEPREDNTFWVTCPSCSTEWGSQRCGACARPFPVVRTRFDAEVTTDSVDHEFGGDVLAIPCWRRVRENTYICPHCGQCGEASQAAIHRDCLRCCDANASGERGAAQPSATTS
jgi:hypothetical protein